MVGLYMNTPKHVVVLCVNEKKQIQALEDTQPLLPLGLVYVEGGTHDYINYGRTTLGNTGKPRSALRKRLEW